MNKYKISFSKRRTHYKFYRNLIYTSLSPFVRNYHQITLIESKKKVQWERIRIGTLYLGSMVTDNAGGK